MNYQEIFESLGFAYRGPCPCRHARGFIYRHPTNFSKEVWIYPSKNNFKVREYDQVKQVIPFTEETLPTLIAATI